MGRVYGYNKISSQVYYFRHTHTPPQKNIKTLPHPNPLLLALSAPARPSLRR